MTTLFWLAGPLWLAAQSDGLRGNEVFIGARFAEQIPISVNAAFLDKGQFRGQHKGIELGYYRRLRNGNSIGLEVFSYVSRYGFAGKLGDCASMMEAWFPFTSRGRIKGVAVYDPLVLTAHYRWRFASGKRNEWRLALGAGVMPFYSRSVSFNFTSNDGLWSCPDSLYASIGYGDNIFPIVDASLAYHVDLSTGHGVQLRAGFTGTLFAYYTGYVAVDVFQPTERLDLWQRRFYAFSVSARYDFAW